MTNKSTVSLQSLCHAIQTMGEKLTHLHLAHNKLAGVPQIVTALSVRATPIYPSMITLNANICQLILSL